MDSMDFGIHPATTLTPSTTTCYGALRRGPRVPTIPCRASRAKRSPMPEQHISPPVPLPPAPADAMFPAWKRIQLGLVLAIPRRYSPIQYVRLFISRSRMTHPETGAPMNPTQFAMLGSYVHIPAGLTVEKYVLKHADGTRTLAQLADFLHVSYAQVRAIVAKHSTDKTRPELVAPSDGRLLSIQASVESLSLRGYRPCDIATSLKLPYRRVMRAITIARRTSKLPRGKPGPYSRRVSQHGAEVDALIATYPVASLRSMVYQQQIELARLKRTANVTVAALAKARRYYNHLITALTTKRDMENNGATNVR